MIALCGQGTGAEGVLEYLTLIGAKFQTFSHDDAWGMRMMMKAARQGMPGTYRSINEPDAWQYSHPPALIISCGYRTIISAEVLRKSAGINCHYALLPRHRGRSSVPWAIVDGDRWTGVSWHWLTPEVDRGNLLVQMACQVDDGETQASLFAKLHQLAIDSGPAAFKLARVGWIGVEQRGRATYHPAGPPNGGKIDPMWDDVYVERFLRAMTMPPLPYATINGAEVRTMEEYYAACGRIGDDVYVF